MGRAGRRLEGESGGRGKSIAEEGDKEMEKEKGGIAWERRLRKVGK